VTDPTHRTLDAVVRAEGSRVLATLVRTIGDLQLAEDAVQEAAIAALRTWPTTRIPDDPRAWLTVAARRKAVDVLRRESHRHGKEVSAMDLRSPGEEPVPDSVVRDDMLRLIFTCCHPALAQDAQVALALRTLCGLSTAEIAAALLVPEPTMAKRLVRVKSKIARAGIPYRVPQAEELPQRLPGVLSVVYLIFTEGHRATSGEVLVRIDLCDEAVRLARLLVDLMPDEPEAMALLALLLFTDSRRDERVDVDGNLVPLAEQDRRRWNQTAIEEASQVLDRALRRTAGRAGPYQLQACLASCHARAPSFESTPWPEIVRLYDLLDEVAPSPVIRLNRAIAVAEVAGPAVALRDLDALTGIAHLHLWHAARAEMLRRLGEREQAAHALESALQGRLTDPERRLLVARLDELHAAGSA
jgi:RNA polymerase sigma factor (sigma-70 family)